MAGSVGKGRRVAEINVTPLVDVVLVLLIIFMVTATYITRQTIEAELPTAASGEAAEETPLLIEVRADRSVFVEGRTLDLQGLADLVGQPDMPEQAIIAADKSVDYGRVTQVIDTLRLAGIAKFGLEIKPGDPPVTP